MKWRKWIAVFATMGLVATITPAVYAEPVQTTVTGNLVKITTAADFSNAQLTNLTVDESIGNGAVKLTDSSIEGELISGTYSCSEFERMVASWNADTPEGATVEITARAHLTGTDIWTDWLSWGEWGTTIARCSGSSETARDTYAYVDTDVLTFRGNSGVTADQFQVRAVLRSKNGATPVLRQLCATLQNNQEGREIVPVYAEDTVTLPEKVILSTPAYSQMVRTPDISTSICNPTTITTLLNDRGEDLLPEQTALGTYDFSYQGFGNWSFALAAAGSFGYDCYIQFGDLDILRQELAKGYSVGIDVHYSPVDHSNLPYVENAPLASSGHLITIRGDETIDGVEYFYVSDSAAVDDQEALRRYRADQLDAAWNNRIVYIIHEKEQNAGTAAPSTANAELKPVDGAQNTYQLVVNGEVMDLTDEFIKNKTLEAGGGTIVARQAEEPAAAQISPAKSTTANCRYFYDFRVTNSGIVIDPKTLFRQSEPGDEHKLIVTVITNTGKSYSSELTVITPSADESSSTEVSVVTADGSVSGDSNRTFPWLWVGIGMALFAIAVVVCAITVNNKKKNPK